MKRLLVAAALAPLSFAAAAHAQTTISTATTAPVSTSTTGDLTITTAGSVTPATSPTAGTVAVTINSNNSVDNEGAITVTEKTTGNSTNQGITTGPFANGGNRTGILVTTGGPFTGNITNAGTITIIGENSQGINAQSGLTGSIVDSGTITVTGGNVNGNVTSTDVSYGIFSASAAPITGNVAISGAITATGANATGVALNGGVGGAVTVNSAITVTGYRSTTPPSNPKTLAALLPDQVAQGGPALSIGGDVTGGIDIAAAVAASGNVTATNAGTLTVFGSAPALLIGGAAPITIGPGPGNNTSSVTIGGVIDAEGTYPDVGATAIQIGGANPLIVSSGGVAAGGNFSTANLTGGLDISGTVFASTVAHTSGNGTVTALDIGQGATVPSILVTGTLTADGANTLTAANAPSGNVTAILIRPGATAGGTALLNAGNITAEVTGVVGVAGVTQTSGGVTGDATAIRDEAGAFSTITSVGNITASVTPAITGAKMGNVSTVAIYADNSAALTITQCTIFDPTTALCSTTGNVTATPSITGDVDFADGTGATTLNLWGGNLTGAMMFGNSTGNILDIEDSGRAKGALTVVSGGQLAVTVDSGQLFITNTGNISLSSLSVGNIGLPASVIFTGDPGNVTGSPSTTLQVAGSATLGGNATVGLALLNPVTTQETFTLINAGNLTTAGNLSSTVLGEIPFLINGNLSATATTLSLTVTPKTAAELGLNPAETALLPAFTKAYGSDQAVAEDLLSKTTRSTFIHAYDQFLPDYAGGPFETLVTGQQSFARAEAESPVKLQTDATRGWVQEIGYINEQQSTSQVNGYQGLGFGLAGGIERASGDGALGVAAAFITTGVQDHTQPSDQSLTATAFEAGVYYRKGGKEGLNVNAAVNGGFVTFGSQRFFLDTPDVNDLSSPNAATVSREAKASWLGGIFSADIGLAYQVNKGIFYARPEVSADYVLLYSQGYQEHGGGPAFNLRIASQTSSQADAQADIVLGLNFGQTVIWRPEVTVGYRAVVSGGPASTVANFAGGSTFTLNPQFTDKGGVLARLGVRASGQYADFSADAGGEFRSGYQTYDARAAARFLF